MLHRRILTPKKALSCDLEPAAVALAFGSGLGALGATCTCACALCSLAMAPRAKVSASGGIGHGITFEVRPAKKGSPTVHVDVAGTRLPAFRLKEGKPVEEQVGCLQQVLEHIARATGASAPLDLETVANCSQPHLAEPHVHGISTEPTQPTQPMDGAAASAEPQPPQLTLDQNFVTDTLRFLEMVLLAQPPDFDEILMKPTQILFILL